MHTILLLVGVYSISTFVDYLMPFSFIIVNFLKSNKAKIHTSSLNIVEMIQYAWIK